MFVKVTADDLWDAVEMSEDEKARSDALEMLVWAKEIEESGLTPVFIYNDIDEKLWVTSQERIDRKLH